MDKVADNRMVAGNDTEAFSFAVTMAWDAFRICIGQVPKTHAPEEVIRWMLVILRVKRA